MKMMNRFGLALVLTAIVSTQVTGTETSELIDSIQSVGQFGEGHPAAVKAVKELQTKGAAATLPILTAMDSANPLALNWLQVAFESIADQAIEEDSLSAKDLEAFVLDRTHHARSRKLAFDWLIKIDETAHGRLIPNMLDDPSGPLRREAVANVISEASKAKEDNVRLALWTKALSGAVDKDQVDRISAALKKLGQPVDLVEHFGMFTKWHVIGPFDNTDMKAFDVAYPPEKEIDLKAKYEGKNGPVHWEHYVSEKSDGAFDLAELTKSHKGAIDYAYTELKSSSNQEVEFRLATANAWKLWVNGELVFSREEYHRGMRFDQYSVRGEIKKGTNTFLLKVCQNEQDQDWAQKWSFQFRIVDDSGRAVTQSE